MPSAFEIVTVNAGGQTYATWTKVTYHASVKDAVRTLELTIADTPGAPIAPSVFAAGTLITAYATGELIFTGYVDRLKPTIDARDYRVVVSASSKGQDVVDCSGDHTKGDYVQKTTLQIAQDQDAFGVGFSTDTQLSPKDRWRPNVGSSLFDSLAALCEDDGTTMFGLEDGSIKMTQAGANPPAQSAPIVEGVDLFIGEADFDWSNRHSHVKAHGQAYKGTGPQATQIMAAATDSNVTRYRPLHIHHGRHTDKARLTKRAKRRRDKEQGEGLRATITMPSWRDRNGALFKAGNKVWVQSPSLFLAQYMLIESVVGDQEGEHKGTIAHLHLVDPRAHGGKGGGVNKSGASWDFDDSAAS